jgi:hypothetical protein
MNKKILLFFFFSIYIYASNILSYNIYDRTDRVDVMLTFDTPYHGKIVKTKYNNKIILKLYDAKIESSKIKHISSKFLKQLSINPMSNYTQIVAAIPSNITLKASKTADSYGLRLRFLSDKTTPLKQTNKTTSQNQPLSNLMMKQESDISTSYYIVIFILVVGIVILLILKKKISQKTNNKNWLFNTPKPPLNSTQMPKQDKITNNDVTIKFQKKLNDKTSIVMFDFLEQSYLLLLGENNNILLDKFSNNKPITTQSEFEEMLEEKSIELDRYLEVENKQTQPPNDILRNFTQKASNTPYEL